MQVTSHSSTRDKDSRKSFARNYLGAKPPKSRSLATRWGQSLRKLAFNAVEALTRPPEKTFKLCCSRAGYFRKTLKLFDALNKLHHGVAAASQTLLDNVDLRFKVEVFFLCLGPVGDHNPDTNPLTTRWTRWTNGVRTRW